MWHLRSLYHYQTRLFHVLCQLDKARNALKHGRGFIQKFTASEYQPRPMKACNSATRSWQECYRNDLMKDHDLRVQERHLLFQHVTYVGSKKIYNKNSLLQSEVKVCHLEVLRLRYLPLPLSKSKSCCLASSSFSILLRIASTIILSRLL